MNHLPNPPRGCGTKKKGAFYLSSGASSKSGILPMTTLWYGDGLGTAVYAPIHDRGQVEGAPTASLVNEVYTSVATGAMRASSEYMSYWGRVHSEYEAEDTDFSLFDYVGKKNYPVWSMFLEEGNAFGYSRRVSEAHAVKFATRVPFPLLLVYNMPTFPSRSVSKMRKRWADAEFNYRPAWKMDAWSCHNASDGMEYGQDHYLHWLGIALSSQSHEDHEFALGVMRAATRYDKQVIASTWITSLQYTRKEDDTDSRLLQLIGNGVEVGEI